jgi:peptidoglycan L-alanyl-D-glutamate endopeptidase CwlK
MPSFSKSSKNKLATCHPDLITLFNEVIKYFDCKVICGRRGKTAQNNAFINGFSKVRYPNSKHNPDPSMAADVIPYPIDWTDLNRMKFFAGFVLGIAQKLLDEGKMSHKVISGLDWDADTELKDTTFVDHPHFQLKVIK